MGKDVINNFLSFLVGLLLGVIGLMFTINTYVFDLQNKQIELERLLNDAETSADYGMRFKDINIKINQLEVYLAGLENIEPFYNLDLSLPKNLSEKKKLIQQMRKTPELINRQKLIGLMFQENDEYISEIAEIAFLKTMRDGEINTATKRAISSKQPSFVIFQRKLSKKINNNNLRAFERAWFMYAELNDLYASILLKEVHSEQPISKETLIKMRNFANIKQLKECRQIIEKLLVE